MRQAGTAQNGAGPARLDLFALAPAAMVVCHRQGLVQSCNNAFARLVGWQDGKPSEPLKFKDLLTRPSQYIFGSQVVPPLHLLGAVEEIELDIIATGGEKLPVLLGATQMDDGSGEILHCYSLTPIKGRRAYAREQMAARAELERKEGYLNLAEQLAKVGHWHADLTSGDVFWSPEVYAIHGLDRVTTPVVRLAQAIGLYHADDRAAVRNCIAESIASNQPFAFEKRLAATPTRGERVVEARGVCEYDLSGNATGVFGVLRDVTAARRAQQDLETSEERYRLLADSVPGLIGYWDRDLRCRFANRAYQEWTRFGPEALVGVSMGEVAGETLLEQNRPHITAALAGERQSFERDLTIPTGEVRNAWIQYLPDRGPDGTVRGFYSMITDVTALKARDLAEQQSSALKSAILSSTHYMVIAITPQGVVTEFNAAAETALGYSAEEVIGKLSPMSWHLESELAARRAALSRELGLDIAPGVATFALSADWFGSDTHEWTMVRKDGTSFPARMTITPLQAGPMAPTGYLAVVEDITQSKQAQEALRTSEETFRIAMEHASIGMCVLDAQGSWLRVNRSLAQMLGYSQTQLLALDYNAVTHPDERARCQTLVGQLVSGHIETFTLEKRYLRRDGEEVWAQTSASVVRNADGSAKYLVAQIQDITERREVERVKNELISTVSHELRTPATSIRGALGLLAGTMAQDLPANVSKLVDIANTNSKRLILLVNDMLDIDKIASGQMAFEMLRQPLGPLILAAIEANQPYAQRFDVSMVSNADNVDITVEVDAARLQQVMSNLLSNAAKFSPRGGEVSVQISHGPTHCRVAVIDQGDGVPPAFAPLIFGKFTRADSSATRSKYGSGLGLHISREMVMQMGGTIDFSSTPGDGATFWIELPLAAPD